MLPEQVIKRPIVMSEKAERLRAQDNQYLFEVDMRATKQDVKRAVEALFKVDVVQVRTMIVRGKRKRAGRTYVKRDNWKKAIVTVKRGESIDFFEGA